MGSAKPSSSFDVAGKRPTLYLAIVAIWLLVLAFLGPSLWGTFQGLDSVISKALFLPLAGGLGLFWFYGVYHLVFLAFSRLYQPKAKSFAMVTPELPCPKVAVIYTTYNDFNKGAALTCLSQRYPDYRTFILDVSTNPEKRREVDAFHREFASSTTLVRLQPRQGFKARSLNDTLKAWVGDEYKFFAVCDADNYLPPDFLSRMVPYFFLDDRIGFVQATHVRKKQSENKFAQDFGIAIDASWYLHQIPRDRYGLLMCMGHSVVVRREAWEKVEGYPELVQEDTAFTMRLRQRGYYGVFVSDVVCGEEFPEDLRRFQRRQFRLVQADAEILLTQVPRFLGRKAISSTEKFDLVARTVRIPAQSLTLPFIILTFLLLPLANEGSLSRHAMDSTFNTLLSPGVWGATWLLAVAPLYPFVIHLRRRPWKLGPLIFRSVTLHYSLSTLALVSFVSYLLRGKASFVVTGTQDGAAIRSQPRGRFRDFIQQLNVDSSLVAITELGAGISLAYIGFASRGLVLLGIAFMLLMSPLARRFGWHNKAISMAVYLSPSIVLAGLVGSLLDFAGSASQFLALSVLAVLLF